MSHPANYWRPGLGDVGSYQVSGIPYVTGGIDCSSTAKVINFPSVTSWINIHHRSNIGGVLKIAFSENAVEATGGPNMANNYFQIGPLSGSTGVLDLKVTQVWLKGSSDVQVVAGLTSIEPGDINNLALSPDGVNWSGSSEASVG